MPNTQHIHHSHRHGVFSYPVSIRQRLYSAIIIPVIILLVVGFVVKNFGGNIAFPHQTVTAGFLSAALLLTVIRLLVAYILALVISIPLALLISYSPKAERILFPLFDIMQSIPVLAFFPVIILLFVHYNFYNGAAIFILLITMMWSIVFSVVGGLNIIPQDIKSAAQVFHITKWAYIKKVLLPAVFPYVVTGSLLAWASGWNIVIVAEVLHTYIPGGIASQDLFGIGSVLVNSAAAGNTQEFLMALGFMVVLIGLLNFFVWQKLLKYSERFKFE